MIDLGKIEDDLELINGFPWHFKPSKDLDRVFDSSGNALVWLATDKETDKVHGRFIAEAPQRILKLVQEIRKLREEISCEKTISKSAGRAKTTRRN